MKKFELFPTTVLEFDFTNHSDIPSLLDIIEKQEAYNHPLLEKGTSNFSQSSHFLTLPELISLKNDFQKCVDHYSENLEIISSYIYDSWFNIIYKNGKTRLHHHGSSIISGAFYPVLEDNTCNLLFRSPLYSALNFLPLPTNPHPHFQRDVVMPIKENHLYLFPGWLQHHTEVNRGGKRITVSFNTKFY
jgi:uncharacterized protein (TIGR02466 family)